MAIVAEHYKERYIYPYTNPSSTDTIRSGAIVLAGGETAGGISYKFPAFVLHDIKPGETESVSRYGQWTVYDNDDSAVTFVDGQPVFVSFTDDVPAISDAGDYILGQAVGNSYTTAQGKATHVAVFPSFAGAVIARQLNNMGVEETITDIATLKTAFTNVRG